MFLKRLFMLAFVIGLSLSVVSCSYSNHNDNDNPNGKSDRESEPLEKNQSVNDKIPSMKRGRSSHVATSFTIMRREMPDPSMNETIISIGNHAQPSQFCQVVVLEADEFYDPSAHSATLNASSYKNLASTLTIGQKFLGARIAYTNSQEQLFIDPDTLDVYVDIKTRDMFDFSLFDYYSIIVCGNDFYSTFDGSAQIKLTQDKTAIAIQNLNVAAPNRPAVMQPEPIPSDSLFVTHVSFNGMDIPQRGTCSYQYMIVSVPKAKNYNPISESFKLFEIPIADLKSKVVGDSLLNATIIYVNDDAILYQDENSPTGAMYVTTNIVSGVDTQANNYYPILICDTIYSDFAATMPFTLDNNGRDINPNDVEMSLPIVALQPNTDPVFGDTSTSGSSIGLFFFSPVAAFNQNGSSYNFVLDLGNMPDPDRAKCKYSASIDYSAVIRYNGTPKLPTTEADFQSLYPGGQFGNSEHGGVMAVVKNPVIHNSTSGGHFIGMRSTLPKPVKNYINVAFCQLDGGTTYAGYSLANDTTFNKDTAQVLHFDVHLDTVRNTKALVNRDTYIKFTDANFSYAPRIVLQPDNTITQKDLIEAVENGTCTKKRINATTHRQENEYNAAGGMFAITPQDVARLPYVVNVLYDGSIGVSGKDYRNITGMIGTANIQHITHTVMQFSSITMLTDYRDVYAQSILFTKPWSFWAGRNGIMGADFTISEMLDNPNVLMYIIIGCNLGNGNKFKTDITKLQPGRFVTNGTDSTGKPIIEFQPRPYIVPITREN